MFGCLEIMSIIDFYYSQKIFMFINDRFATIQNCLKGMREARISTLGRFQIPSFLLPLESWKIYTMQEVTIQ